MPEHWIEPIVAVLAAVAATAMWAFTVSSRVTVLEKLFEAHLHEKQIALRDINDHIMRIEGKIDHLHARCLSNTAALHRPAAPPDISEDDNT